MSTLKADNIQSKTSGTDLSISGLDGGVPNLEAGFKICGVAGIGTASIQNSAVTLAKMADDSVGVAQLSATGTASSSVFLRGDNSWADPGGGPDQATQAEIEGQTNVDKYIPPDLQKHGPSSCKVWAYVSRGGGTPTLGGPSYNMTSVTDDGDSQTIMTIATDFSSVTYSPTACMIADSTSFAYVHTLTAGSFKVKVCNDGGGSEDSRDFACQAFGDQA